LAFLPPVTQEIEPITRPDTVIELGTHAITLRTPKSETMAVDWLTANKVKPMTIFLGQTILAVDGRIQCRAIAQPGDVVVNPEATDGWAETQIDVPMTHAPHEFGL
jgi:hypothetical protein